VVFYTIAIKTPRLTLSLLGSERASRGVREPRPESLALAIGGFKHNLLYDTLSCKYSGSQMAIQTERILYQDQGSSLEAFAAYSSHERRPLVILCHAWRGRDDFICEKAILLAEWGYAAFALDIYGKGVLGHSKEENTALKAPFLADRYFLQRRLLASLEIAKALPYVDPERIAALGFGFGGLCALDLARSSDALKGAVSVYGHFAPLPDRPHKPVQAKILILHGYRDPIVSMEELALFEQEMNKAKADWQVHVFSDAMHAFVNPSANDPSFGTVYHPIAAQRSWRLIQDFLKESLLQNTRNNLN
jgi:dienelactone hydrolase